MAAAVLQAGGQPTFFPLVRPQVPFLPFFTPRRRHCNSTAGAYCCEGLVLTLGAGVKRVLEENVRSAEQNDSSPPLFSLCALCTYVSVRTRGGAGTRVERKKWFFFSDSSPLFPPPLSCHISVRGKGRGRGGRGEARRGAGGTTMPYGTPPLSFLPSE